MTLLFPSTRPVRALAALIVGAGFLAGADRARAEDFRAYPRDARVDVLVHWESFAAQGIPASWRVPLTDSVINAYTLWNQIAGARVRPKFRGYVQRSEPRAGEIVVSMNEKHAASTRVASRFSRGTAVSIVFHRKSGATGTPWNFTPFRARPGEIDMQAVLMHEFGHAFGLDHEDDPRSVMYPSVRWAMRYGPTAKDIQDLRRQYGTRVDLRFAVKRSTDHGESWSNVPSNLRSLGARVSTTGDPSAARDPSGTSLFFTDVIKRPTLIRGDVQGRRFERDSLRVLGRRSIYGTGGHGYGGEYMAAWVDDTDGRMRVRLAFSQDEGNSWQERRPVGASIGTPAVLKLAANTWVLAYAKLDLTSQEDTGQVVTRVSRNDGVSWGPEVVLHDLYRAVQGVSLAGAGPGEFRLAFAWSRRSAARNQAIRTFRCSLRGTEPVLDGRLYGSDLTRTRPALARSSRGNLLAWREVNAATSIATRPSSATGPWGTKSQGANSSPVTPALAAYRSWSYAFLYYLTE